MRRTMWQGGGVEGEPGKGGWEDPEREGGRIWGRGWGQGEGLACQGADRRLGFVFDSDLAHDHLTTAGLIIIRALERHDLPATYAYT